MTDGADKRPECVIEVGHMTLDRTATWRGTASSGRSILVCDRHKSHYEERADEFPMTWERVDAL